MKERAEKLDLVETEADMSTFSDPRLAAKERAIRRTAMTTSLFSEESSEIDVSAAEVKYEVCFSSVSVFLMFMEPLIRKFWMVLLHEAANFSSAKVSEAKLFNHH